MLAVVAVVATSLGVLQAARGQPVQGIVNPWDGALSAGPSVPTAYASQAVFKDSKSPLTALTLGITMGDHAYKDFPNEKFSAWKVVTQLGSENVTDLRVLYKDRPGGYSYHLYTDEQGQQRCSTGAQTQAADMLDFSWLGTSQITAGQNMTVQVPGKESPTLCIVYHEAQNPSHFACLVDLGGAKFAGQQQQQPVLHQDGSKQLFFTSFTPLAPENFPPSSPIFAAPGTCQSSQAPPPKPGTSWQVLLGSCVGAFLVGSGATLLVLYCRGRKREDDPRAYQAALLDVM